MAIYGYARKGQDAEIGKEKKRLNKNKTPSLTLLGVKLGVILVNY